MRNGLMVANGEVPGGAGRDDGGAVTLRAEAVWKDIGERPVLRDIGLEVRRGECVVICGPSGSGKTTLLRAIAGLERIQRGEIWVAGRLRNSPRGPQLGKGDVGMVFQGEQLYAHLTVLDNITLAPKRVTRLDAAEAERRASDLLDSVRLLDRAASFPHELSGGQRQRVAIVRALAMDPALLLLDEPTSALDPASASETLALIDRVREMGKTVVLVTHEMGFARMSADRIVCIDEGTIREVDVPGRLMLRPQSMVTRRFFGHTLQEISALDRVLHTKTLNVGWLPDTEAALAEGAGWLADLAEKLEATVCIKKVNGNGLDLDIRTGSVDLIVGRHEAGGETSCCDACMVHEGDRQYCVYLSATDSVWRREIEGVLAQRAQWRRWPAPVTEGVQRGDAP